MTDEDRRLIKKRIGLVKVMKKTLKNENHGAIITTALHHLNHEINLL